MAVDINTHKLDFVFNSVIAGLQCDQVRNCRSMRNGYQMSLHVLIEVSPMILSATSCLKDTSISSAKNIYIVRIWGVVGFFSVLRCFSLVDFFESQK